MTDSYPARLVSVSGAVATVVAPDYSPRPVSGPYVAPGGAPMVGGVCVLQFDDTGAPLVVFAGVGGAAGPSADTPFASLTKFGTD